MTVSARPPVSLPLFTGAAPRRQALRGWRVATGALLALGLAGLWPQAAWTQTAAAQQAASATPLYWLQRWQQAAASQAYGGTVVTSGERGNLRSARIWHAVKGGQQIERIDSLSGRTRSVFRTETAVTVFLPQQKLVRVRSHMPGLVTLFAGTTPLDVAQQAVIAKHYRLLPLGRERVANHDADVVGFVPLDGLRHGFRFWSDTSTGLMLKWQMLELPPNATTLAGGRMLRETAFSDVQVPAPLPYEVLAQMMQDTKGYTVQRHALQPVALAAQGWGWRTPLPGYFVTQCFSRTLALPDEAPPGGMARGQSGAPAAPVTQCMLSDGLGSISLFIEAPAATGQSRRGPQARRGATQVLTQSHDSGHVVTVMGEVPAAALQAVLQSLYRKG